MWSDFYYELKYYLNDYFKFTFLKALHNRVALLQNKFMIIKCNITNEPFTLRHDGHLQNLSNTTLLCFPINFYTGVHLFVDFITKHKF